ncbi:MAG: ABC transporter ATP-binding protein [Xanthomonadales bacterium]|nr:ABC transporter ATP-binding protein [Xanthomonadales bacterium]
MRALRFESVDYAHDGVPALEGISFEVPAGKLTAVVGPSGCGKSTLIALAAGLLEPGQGRVVNDCKRVAVAFQDSALLPWKTARDNVGFALLAEGLPRDERRDRADKLLTEAGLAPEDWDKYPRQLSGGMRQRVALARALSVRPDLLLCDEPFSALDARARKELRRMLNDIHHRERLTTVWVTHDNQEALARADVLVVMSMRRIEQVGAPEDLLTNPANAFVKAQLAG